MTGWKSIRTKLLWLLIIPVIFILVEMSRLFPADVERIYTYGIYPSISGGVSAFTGLVPFSIAEVIVCVALAALVALLVYGLAQLKRGNRPVWHSVVGVLLSVAVFVGGVLGAFYMMWGLNYSRPSVAYSMGLELKERDPQELVQLVASLAVTASALREQLPEDADGVYQLPEGNLAALQKIPTAYANLGQVYPQFARNIPAPKALASSELFSYAGISGIFIPFTEEANVNVHQHPLLICATGAHEAAHLMGVAREDEANFIGFLACLASEDAFVQYSGVVMALIYAGNQLNDLSKDAYAQLQVYYSDALKRDLRAHAAYWDQYEGKTQEVVNQINDTYLKSNAQDDGVLSYGRMVDLLLAYFDQQRSG